MPFRSPRLDPRAALAHERERFDHLGGIRDGFRVRVTALHDDCITTACAAARSPAPPRCNGRFHTPKSGAYGSPACFPIIDYMSLCLPDRPMHGFRVFSLSSDIRPALAWTSIRRRPRTNAEPAMRAVFLVSRPAPASLRRERSASRCTVLLPLRAAANSLIHIYLFFGKRVQQLMAAAHRRQASCLTRTRFLPPFSFSMTIGCDRGIPRAERRSNLGMRPP